MSHAADATSESAGSIAHRAATAIRPCEPRVYLECTTTCSSRYNTGIQRTVRSIVAAAADLPGSPRCVPIVYNGRYFKAVERLPALHHAGAGIVVPPHVTEGLRRAFNRVRSCTSRLLPFAALREWLYSRRLEFALRRGVVAAQNLRRWVGSFSPRDRSARVDFGPGDVIVLLDATWGIDLSRELRRARDHGARVLAVVHDLIPIDHPDLAPEGLPLLLDAWLMRTVPLSDGILTISRPVADDVRGYLQRRLADVASSLRVDSFPLGSGLDPSPVAAVDIARVSEVFERHTNGVYLVVGTIEPRKDCARILAAFERLWSERSNAVLMFFGRAGWRSYDLIDRIRAHPEKDRRLFWFENGSDVELDFAYRHATALIFASRHEGFGLPLVEAMSRGLPVLASDIPVFREIGGDYPEFFRPGDEVAIYDTVHRFANAQVSGPRRPSPRSWLSWSESARVLREKVTESRSERAFGPRPAAVQGRDTRDK